MRSPMTSPRGSTGLSASAQLSTFERPAANTSARTRQLPPHTSHAKCHAKHGLPHVLIWWVRKGIFLISWYNIRIYILSVSTRVTCMVFPISQGETFGKKKPTNQTKKAPAPVEQIQSSWSGILLFTLFAAIIYPVVRVQGLYKRTPNATPTKWVMTP